MLKFCSQVHNLFGANQYCKTTITSNRLMKLKISSVRKATDTVAPIGELVWSTVLGQALMESATVSVFSDYDL